MGRSNRATGHVDIVMRFFSHLRFRFRLIPFIAALAAVGIGISLGQWQLGRADQKQAIEVKLAERDKAPLLAVDSIKGDAAEIEFRRLQLRGEFLRNWPLYLDNRPYQGRAGLYVLMPFRLWSSNQVVLVERGWIARDGRDRARVPVLVTPPGQIVLEARVRRAPGHVMQLGQAPKLQPGAIVQNLNLAELAQASALPLEPYLVEQTSDTADSLVRDWPRPSSGIERHLGYAFQWYALAAMACVFFVVTGFKRGKSATA